MFPSLTPAISSECVAVRTMNAPIRDSSNRYTSFFNFFVPFTRCWGIFTAIGE